MLIIGGEYTASLPSVEVVTDDFQILSRLVPDAPDRNVYWTAEKVGMYSKINFAFKSLIVLLYCIEYGNIFSF